MNQSEQTLGKGGRALGVVTLAALLLVGLFEGLASSASTWGKGIWRLGIGQTLGMFLMVTLLFLYTTHYEIPLLPTNTLLMPCAAVALGVAAWLAIGSQVERSPSPRDWSPVWMALPLLLPQ